MASVEGEPGGGRAPVVLCVRGWSLTVDPSPLPLRQRGNEALSLRAGGLPFVVRADGNTLVIRLSVKAYGCFLLTAPLGTAGAALFATAAARPDLLPRLSQAVPPSLRLWLAGLFLLWLLFWFFLFRPRAVARWLFGGGTVLFDRAAGKLIYGPFGARRSRPLADVVAVQLALDTITYAGSRAPRPASPPGAPGPVVSLFQVNLVLDDRTTPRVNVAMSRDATRARQVGRQIADFLGVPLVDQTGAAGSASP